MRDKKQELTTELYPQNLSHSGQMTKLLVELSFVPQISILKRQGKNSKSKKNLEKSEKKQNIREKFKIRKEFCKNFQISKKKKNPEKNLEFQIRKKNPENSKFGKKIGEKIRLRKKIWVNI